MFLVLWVEHYYNPKLEEYEQTVHVKLFDDFGKAKDFAEDLYERRLNPEMDFVAILPCLALYSSCSQRDSDFDFPDSTYSILSFPPSPLDTGSRIEEGIV